MGNKFEYKWDKFDAIPKQARENISLHIKKESSKGWQLVGIAENIEQQVYFVFFKKEVIKLIGQ